MIGGMCELALMCLFWRNADLSICFSTRNRVSVILDSLKAKMFGRVGAVCGTRYIPADSLPLFQEFTCFAHLRLGMD